MMKRAVTIHYLIQHLEELLQAKATNILTVSGLTNNLSISRSTFYRYFPNGTASIYQLLIQEHLATLQQRNFSDWHQLVSYCVFYLNNHQASCRLIYRVLCQQNLLKWFYHEILNFLNTYSTDNIAILEVLQNNWDELELITSAIFHQLNSWLETDFQIEVTMVLKRLDIVGYLLTCQTINEAM